MSWRSNRCVPDRGRRAAQPARTAPEGSARRWRSPRCNCLPVPRARRCGQVRRTVCPTGEPLTHNRSSEPKLVNTNDADDVSVDDPRRRTDATLPTETRHPRARTDRARGEQSIGRGRRTPRRRDVAVTAIAPGSLSHESSHSPTTGATTSSTMSGTSRQRRFDDALVGQRRRSSSRSTRSASPTFPIREWSTSRSAHRRR